MSFVTDLMKKPAILMLTLALVSSVCVVGCGQADSGGGSDAPASSPAEGGSGDGSGSEEGSGSE